MNQKFTVHPWHGIEVGEEAPEVVNVFVEIVPTDTVKYEVDKPTGYVKVDRPQKFSNIMPAAYGFIPKTYCEDEVKDLAVKSGATEVTEGDHDPLDICVLSSHQLRGGILLRAIPVGGFKMIDRGEADDKIIAVLEGDQIYGDMKDISEVPVGEINRLKHYFLSYKNLPTEPALVKIDVTYGAAHAKEVIVASINDYNKKYGE